VRRRRNLAGDKPLDQASVERQVVEMAAWRYARAYGGEWDDYAQEARLAVEQARRTYHADLGAWRSYIGGAVYRALRGYASKARSPVSGSLHKLKELDAAHATTLVAYDEKRSDGQRPAVDKTRRAAYLALSPAHPEALYSADEWQRNVATRIRVVLDHDPDGEGDMARLVLLHGRRAQDVADQLACPRWRVYRAARRCRLALASDPVLRSLVLEE